ncbi:IclR family transcriptional regulator domain-containing protein [Falsiroseomonas sp. HW251]|uniref:IclR family transcriptional regulator domain-containing protein n=1 Tax=Falsiroseomonas sp. HW251 TaxID=3390998 RepID=UPI003D323257
MPLSTKLPWPQPLSRHADLPREELRTLAKGLAAIEAFDEAHPAMTLSEVARRTGISPGAAQRILRTLTSLGYVGSDGTRFSLRPRALQLGYAYLASLPLAAIAQPLLGALSAQTGGSSSLAVLDEVAVVYVARSSAQALARDYMAVGTRLPAQATSVGKVLLAALPAAEREARVARIAPDRLTPHTLADPDAIGAALDRVAAEGFALNDQETALGMRSIAVPVMAAGRTVAALGMSSEVVRTTLATMKEAWLPAMRATAASIGAALAGR